MLFLCFHTIAINIEDLYDSKRCRDFFPTANKQSILQLKIAECPLIYLNSDAISEIASDLTG